MSAPTNSNPASNRITVPGIGDPSQPETVIVVRGHGRFDVVAYNECGHNWTETDLKALLDWIHDNRPWILKEIGYSKESAG